MPRYLSVEKRDRLVQLLREHHTVREVAAIEHVSPSTVLAARERFEETGTNASRPKSGRPRLLSPLNERYMGRLLRTGECDNSIQVKNVLQERLQLNVNPRTVQRSLFRYGFRARVKAKKPLLLDHHRQQRLDFARQYQHWTVEDWQKVMFADECKVNVSGHGGRQYRWRKRYGRVTHRDIQPTVKFGGGGFLLFGIIGWYGFGALTHYNGIVKAKEYCTFTEGNLERTCRIRGVDIENSFYLHDNDPKHRSKMATAMFERLKLRLVNIPPQSPDLNPIEHA
jgi:transposase